MQDNHLFRPLFQGAIDVVGDIHGELGALLDLLRVLGYTPDGRHPGKRRLAFIGDLCDRGEDSPGVIALVRQMVDAGLAQCLLGNHEQNLLMNLAKEGNGWFFDPNHDHARGKFRESRQVNPAGTGAVREFCRQLPLVLERPDLRLVHAAWDDAAISLLRECRGSTQEIYEAYAHRARDIARESGLNQRASDEWRQHGRHLGDEASPVPLLESMGRLDALHQMANPVRILTSGPEALARRAFFAAGRWRMVDRVPWWRQYHHDTPVLVGHYWRWPTPEMRAQFSRGEHNLFGGIGANEWHGVRRNVFCLDFGVGARYKERANGVTTGFTTRLGAVRWPERELVMDDGTRMSLH